MKHRLLILILLSTLISTSHGVKAQLTQLQNACSLYFSPEFISDGQEYFATLKPDQKVEFKTTFFGDNTYRIVACSSIEGRSVAFSIYDTEKNLLFANSNYNYTPYWDFKFTSTITCLIQVDIKSEKFISGHVMMLIGYKP